MPPKFFNRNNNNKSNDNNVRPKIPGVVIIRDALGNSHPVCCRPNSSSLSLHRRYCLNPSSQSTSRHGYFGAAGVSVILYSYLAAHQDRNNNENNENSHHVYSVVDLADTKLSKMAVTTNNNNINNSAVAFLVGYDVGKNGFTVCNGKMSKENSLVNDQGCAMKAACREVAEEFKIDLKGENGEHDLPAYITDCNYEGNTMSILVNLDTFLAKKYEKRVGDAEGEEKKQNRNTETDGADAIPKSANREVVASFEDFFASFFATAQQNIVRAYQDEKVERCERTVRDAKWLIFPDLSRETLRKVRFPTFDANNNVSGLESDQQSVVDIIFPSHEVLSEFGGEEISKAASILSAKVPRTAASASRVQQQTRNEQQQQQQQQRNEKEFATKQAEDDDDVQVVQKNSNVEETRGWWRPARQ